MSRRASSRLPAAVALLLLLSVGPSAARAETPAVERLVDGFAAGVPAAPSPDATVALALRAGGEATDAPAAGELGRLVDRLLSGALRSRAGFGHVVRVPPGSGAEDAARAAGARLLVDATMLREGDDLVLAGTAVPTWRNFWSGETNGIPVPLQARVPADRAARLLAEAGGAAQPMSGALRLQPLLPLAGQVAAVAVGDADGDGVAEVAVLTDLAVTVLRLEGGSATVLAARPLDVRPPAVTPSRDPVGGVVVARFALTPAVAWHHTDRAGGEVLALEDGALRPVTTLDEVPVAAGGGAVLWGRRLEGQNDLEGALRLAPERGSHTWLDAGTPVVAAALDARGERAWAVGRDARLHRLDDLGAPVLGDVRLGAGLAVADLDGDGALEIVGSAAEPAGGEDRLLITDGTGAVRESRAVPGAVRALAAGDLTDDGRADVVVGARGPDGSWLYLLTEDRG